MPPSGEVFIARDNHGTLWLIPPPGAGQAEIISDEIVDRAVVDHGFQRVEESFPSWDLLDAERQRRAGEGLTPVKVDVTHFDAEDVRRLLGALDRARAKGQIPRARRFAHRLLEAPVVRNDDALYERIVSFLLALDEIPAPMPLTISGDAEPSGRAVARERVHILMAA